MEVIPHSFPLWILLWSGRLLLPIFLTVDPLQSLCASHFVEAERFWGKVQRRAAFCMEEFRCPESPNSVMEYVLRYPFLFSLVLMRGYRRWRMP